MRDLSAPNLKRIQAVLDAVPSPIFIKDRAHRIVFLNDSACQFFGHSRDVMFNCADHDLYPPEQVAVFHAVDEKVFTTGIDHENEEGISDPSGRVRHVVTRKRRLQLDGSPYLIGVITDVTAIRESEAHNRYMALHDALTGLPNRALLNERLERALLRHRRGRSGMALVYVDLDRFKSINDTLGHGAGDELLREFAERLTTIARASDTVARLGGDEFAILLEELEGDFNAGEFCNRVLAAAGRAFALSVGEAHVDASVGVVPLPSVPVTSSELHRRADVALYEAKSAGRGCFRLYSEKLDARTRRRRQIELDLRVALASGEGLSVCYQPVIGVDDGRVHSVEALARWNHPTLGALAPAEFISIAEESGLIGMLGDRVLCQAARTMAAWPDLPVAVNLSPVQLRAEDIVERILAIVDQAGLARDRLQIEVTETAMFDSAADAVAKLRSLREAGVKIVLDDFGTGYSSLAHLQRLEVDRVKIDRSFVARLAGSEDSRAIVLAVLGIGRTLGIRVTAEGVETEGQREFLAQSGCDEFQGYLFSRPLDETALSAYLANELETRDAA